VQRRTLLAIVILAAVVRLVPVWFGLPYLRARPDEDAALDHALGVLHNGLNPHFFHWPSLTFYLFAALFQIASWARQLVGAPADVPIPALLVIGRTCVAIAGTLTVLLLFDLGRRVGDELVGAIAALFLAVAILHVRESHFAMSDALMTMFATGSLLCIVRAVADPSLFWFTAAGVAGGLATSTKYSAALVVIPMVIAQLLLWLKLTPGARALPARSFATAVAPSLVFAASFLAAFLATTPYAILDYPAFSSDLGADFEHLSAGHALNVDRAWLYHLTRSLPYGLGIPIFAAAIPGGLILLTRHRRWAEGFVVTGFAAAFFVSMSRGHTVFFRYVLPLVPILCLCAALAVRQLAEVVRRRFDLSLPVVTASLGIALAALPLVNTVWFDLLLMRTDTRVVAGRWLAGELTSASTMHQAGGVFNDLYLPGVAYHRWHFYPEANSFGDPEGRTPEWLVFAESPVWTYASVSPLLHQLAADRYQVAQVVQATSGDDRSAVYDLEDAFFMPLNRFNTVDRPGPNITIYRRRDALTAR